MTIATYVSQLCVSHNDHSVLATMCFTNCMVIFGNYACFTKQPFGKFVSQNDHFGNYFFTNGSLYLQSKIAKYGS